MKYDRYSYESRFGKKYDEPLKQILAKTQWYWDHDGTNLPGPNLPSNGYSPRHPEGDPF